MIAVVAIVIIASLLLVFVYLPWSSRGDDYGNDPEDVPDEVTDGGGDEGDEPDWQMRFQFKLLFKVEKESDGDWELLPDNSGAVITLKDWQDYDGQPWELSMAEFAPKDMEASYKLTLHNKKTHYKTEGDVNIKRAQGATDIYWDAEGKDSKWFFFWEEQDPSWSWSFSFWINNEVVTERGTFTISDGKLVES